MPVIDPTQAAVTMALGAVRLSRGGRVGYGAVDSGRVIRSSVLPGIEPISTTA